MTRKTSFFRQIKDSLSETQEEKLVEKLQDVPEDTVGDGEREDFVRRMKEKLDALNAEILALEARTLEVQEADRGGVGGKVEKLRQLAGDCYQRLDLARQHSGESWERYREGTEVLWKSLEEAVEEAKRFFPSSRGP